MAKKKVVGVTPAVVVLTRRIESLEKSLQALHDRFDSYQEEMEQRLDRFGSKIEVRLNDIDHKLQYDVASDSDVRSLRDSLDSLERSVSDMRRY